MVQTLKDRVQSAQLRVATLVTSAAARRPTPPSKERLARIAARTRRDPVWRKTD